ncbi:MAG: anti-sigma factor antagonist [Candidatus Tectimicrobiota bacterium]|nr:MAG: anti-sigma factor antagonist [Candidatus Tectomicrobia bacterium]
MGLSVHEEQGVAVVEVSGELDAAHHSELGDTIERLLTQGQRRVVLDLHDVPFIDSMGLATLVRCFKRVRSGAGRLALASLQPAVRRVLELTRLDRAFDVHGDVSEAIRHMSGRT